MSNFLEIAEQYKNGEISSEDPRLKKAELLIAEIVATEEGKKELAEIIGITLQNNMNFIDLATMLTTSRHFNLGENPEFRTKKKGIKAYFIAPNSSTPKSRNYDSVMRMEFETLSVRPECLLDDLETGRVGSLLELIQDGQEALRIAIVKKIVTILDQVYNETNNTNNYFLDTPALNADTLKKAINQARYKNGGKVTIFGDEMLINQITEFEGFTEATQNEIMKTGKIGIYYGANIVSVREMYDEANDESVLPKNKIYIISDKIGYSATYGKIKSGQETSIEDWTWNARYDMEWGMAVTNPKAMAIIEIDEGTPEVTP